MLLDKKRNHAMATTARGRGVVAALLLLAASACTQVDTEAPAGGYGQWAAEDPGRWPRIAMVSRIQYSDSNHPMAGSAFLLDHGDEIVATTAKHVLRYFKSEAMDSVSFRGTLVSWEMFPKDLPSDVTVVGTMINEDANQPLDGFRAPQDWLLFSVEQASEHVTPLRLRATPLEPGETLFVVGWRYTDEGRQHVYRGRFVRSDKGSVLIDVSELADNTVPGLSGAPVIDSHGYVVGMMSSKSGKLERLAPVDYPKAVLAQKTRKATESRGVANREGDSSECAQRMTETFGRRGWVGITPEVDATGVISAVDVFKNSPADEADVRRGDTILGINGIARDSDPAAFKSAYDSLRPGLTVTFDLERDGDRLSVEVLVKPIPDTVLEQWIRSECP